MSSAANTTSPSLGQLASLYPQEDLAYLAGVVLDGLMYGILAVFAYLSFTAVLRASSLRSHRTQAMLLVILVLFILGSFIFSANWYLAEEDFAVYRLFPGGPTMHNALSTGRPMNKLGNVSYSLATMIADTVMLYRVWAVWNKRWVVMIAPGMVYLGAIVMSIMSVYATAKPRVSFYSSSIEYFTLSYFVISTASNAFATVLIASRLMWMTARVKRTLGPEHSKTYTTIAAMIVECAAPYTIAGIILVVSAALNLPLEQPALGVTAQLACITPVLIIWRVAEGRAWAGSTAALTAQSDSYDGNKFKNPRATVQLSRLRFNSNSVPSGDEGKHANSASEVAL